MWYMPCHSLIGPGHLLSLHVMHLLLSYPCFLRLSTPYPSGLREEFTCASFSQAGPLGPQTPHLSVGGTRNTIWHLDMLTGLSVVSKVEVPCGEPTREAIY